MRILLYAQKTTIQTKSYNIVQIVKTKLKIRAIHDIITIGVIVSI